MSNNKLLNPLRKHSPGATKFLTTILESGPKDKLSRIDAYGKHTGPKPIDINLVPNKYIDALETSYESLSDVIGEGLDKLNLKGATEDLVKGINNVKKSVQDKIGTAVGQFHEFQHRIEQDVLKGRSLESLMDLPDDFRKDAFGALEKYGKGVSINGLDLANVVKQGRMEYKDAMAIYNVAKNGDFSSINGIRNALNAAGMTKYGKMLSSVVDLQATSAFIGAVMNEVSKYGVPDMLEEISKHFESEKERDKFLTISVVNAVTRSDMATLQVIVKMVGGTKLLYNYPNIINNILRHYKFSVFYEPKKIVEFRKELLGVLSSIDSDWYYTHFVGSTCTRLDQFDRISHDAIMLLTTDLDKESELDFGVEIVLARDYKKIDIKREVMRMYNTISYPNMPQDPRRRTM